MAKKMWYDVMFGWLVALGALNWGLIGAFKFNLLQTVFGTGTLLDIVYILAGIGGFFLIYNMFTK